MKSLHRNRLSRFVLFSITALVFSACIASEGPYKVSLIELLISPDRYVGEKVSVKGFLDSDVNLYLFLTADHAKIDDYVSAISVGDVSGFRITESNCIDSYVEVSGTLISLPGPFVSIADVSVITDAVSNEVCWSH